jgi:hypothetical protein
MREVVAKFCIVFSSQRFIRGLGCWRLKPVYPLALLLLGLVCTIQTCLGLSIGNLLPANGDTNVVEPPKLSAFIYNTDSTNLTVTFYGRATPSPIRPNFTIIVLGDTQFYSAGMNGGTPEIFAIQTEWVITNRVNRNIVLVTHVGDCVNNGEIEWQWFHVTNALYRLEDPIRTFKEHGIPYGIAPGNHDIYWAFPILDDYRFYNKYFGVPHFAGKDYYGGHYGTNNENHYSLITASGLDLIILYLEYDAGRKTNVMNWANSVLVEHRQRRAIVVTHSLISGLTGEFNAQGQPIYDALKGNTNIFLMMCGHHPGTKQRADLFNGNVIHTLLSDFEALTNGGSGYLRIMDFSPSNSTLRAQAYSPALNQYRPLNEVTLTGIDLSNEYWGYVPIFTISNVQPGVVNSGPWSDLYAGTNYDWYVTVSDGASESRSTRSTFRTTMDYPGSAPPPPPAPYIFRGLSHLDGRCTIIWRSIGGARYQVEFKDDLFGSFVAIVRPQSAETDPSAPGTPSVQSFTDDFTLTGGRPAGGMRLYRVKRVE